jgi:hypothetical protein
VLDKDDQPGPEHIRPYQLFLMKEKEALLSTYLQMVCALRFFFTHTLSRRPPPSTYRFRVANENCR